MSYRQSKAALIRPYLYENDYNVISINTLNGLIDSAISALFNIKDEICIVYRIINDFVKNDFEKKYLQRFGFQNLKSFDLKESDCAETQFLIIATKQYSACILFDFSLAQNPKETVFSSYFNSVRIPEILKILLPEEKFPSERRENTELNTAVSNLIKFSANSIKELDINEAEKSNLENLTQTLMRNEYFAKQSRYISHEIKNHLSIIDIYTKIIQKTNAENEKIKKSTDLIFRSITNITKLLQGLKTFTEADLNVYELNNVISEVAGTAKELALSKNIEIKTCIGNEFNVIIDKDKFQNVILNLIKNAVEAFYDSKQKNKYILISAQNKDEKISVKIENNGNEIKKENRLLIFDEGFTTKETGSGLGLFICRQNLKEQFCDLSLLESSKERTVFEILMNKV